MRKFRHDYKNLLLSLREAASNNQVDLVIEQIDVLSNYSNVYCETLEFYCKDMSNVKNSYLKSFLISKFHEMSKKQIPFHFECLAVIDKIKVEIFDFIRILGISIDNAIEEVAEVEQPKINITIYNEGTQTEFIVENSTKEENIDISKILKHGYSTKNSHSGIGLSIIQEIKKKYPNLFIQYKSKHYRFIVQIIIIHGQEN